MIEKEKSIWKAILPHVIAVVVFLFVTMAYFSPVVEGKVLKQHDVQQFEGAAQELKEYYYKEGKTSAWTGSMFSGMPSYLIGVWDKSPNFLEYLEKPFKALGGNTAGPVFMAMLMAYILFCIMGFKPMVSALGAIAYSLSSYNIIILEAGHVTKAWALAYMPLIVAGIMALFKRKILLAGFLVALGLALQVKSNHLQITYYTGIFCAILFVAFAIETLAKKEIKIFLKASGLMLAAVAIAACCNMTSIFGTLEMARESTRGNSELTQIASTEKESTGLDKDYVFAWSYGKAETFNMMVPNLLGGASVPYGKDTKSVKTLNQLEQNGQVHPQLAQEIRRFVTQYWGNQPITSGPVYLGAIICFLFILGMIVIRSHIKWVFLFATVFFIFLAWGKNFEVFNDFFYYHFPLYSKFRAVSTALVIPTIAMIIIAVWGVKEFFSEEIDKKKLKLALYISAGIIGGIALLLWIMPGAFTNFTSPNDEMWKSYVDNSYYTALLADRQDLLSSDALRSLIFVLLTAFVLFISLKVKNMNKVSLYAVGAIAILVLIDLWGVDKRYLNESNFVTKSTYRNETFAPSVADRVILEDKHPSYRVLNLNNPFGETMTSFYHKSIGGYHAAKLKRYQELIDYRIGGELEAIRNSFSTQNVDSIVAVFDQTTALNMLNAKYIIYHPGQTPLLNPNAMGNGWFVSEYEFVDNADQEIAALNTLDPLKTAVIDKRFENDLAGLTIQPDSMATIELVEYKPNILKYKTKAKSEQLAVLSEIYFSNGWQAYVDGKEVPHFRADWTLRAMRVPAGEHEIEFIFDPQGYKNSRIVTAASTGLLVLVLIGMIVLAIYKRKEEKE